MNRGMRRGPPETLIGESYFCVGHRLLVAAALLIGYPALSRNPAYPFVGLAGMPLGTGCLRSELRPFLALSRKANTYFFVRLAPS